MPLPAITSRRCRRWKGSNTRSQEPASPAVSPGLDLKSVLDSNGRSPLDVASGYELQLCFAGLIKRLRATDATVIAAVQGVAPLLQRGPG